MRTAASTKASVHAAHGEETSCIHHKALYPDWLCREWLGLNDELWVCCTGYGTSSYVRRTEPAYRTSVLFLRYRASIVRLVKAGAKRHSGCTVRQGAVRACTGTWYFYLVQSTFDEVRSTLVRNWSAELPNLPSPGASGRIVALPAPVHTSCYQ
jgi:hypothetical protein